MSRIKTIFAGLVLTAIIGLGVQSQAQTVKVMFAGSSAMWQTLALGAYNAGKCPTGGSGTAPCFHYTAGSNFNLTDGRPTPAVVDGGGTWIVWDSATPPNVWAYIKVDSGVGDRCYFANPACVVGITPFPSAGNKISSTLWGDGSSDTTPPSTVQALFTGAGVKVSVAATDIRPEDAYWATCRTNSIAGNGTPGSGDGTDGLGYNTNNASGTCPKFGAPQAALVGNAVQSGNPAGSTAKANVVAFNISGTDPFTNAAVPKYTTYSVGASPIVFVFQRSGGQLAGLSNVTDAQVQQLFSGASCDASVFGLPAAGIQAYLREPLSGTMNTTEATVFRRPTVPASAGVLGASQEFGVNGANPLNSSVACPSSDGKGFRWRGIGTGEVVSEVQNSVAKAGTDGMTYAFFSYGNIGALANSSSYGYATLNGTDPIFSTYANGVSAYDPGQPVGAGVLPNASTLPSSACGSPAAFPCPENAIWAGGFSFPNVRSGAYRAWSLLRIVSTGTALTNAQKVILSGQSFVVTTTPDYIPALATKATIGGKAFTDPGLTLVRSHYQQTDGNGNKLGPAPVNSGTKEAGGDMGGCIVNSTNLGTQLIQSNANSCVVR